MALPNDLGAMAAKRWFVGLRFAGAQGYEELIWELDDGRATLRETPHDPSRMANGGLSPPAARWQWRAR